MDKFKPGDKVFYKPDGYSKPVLFILSALLMLESYEINEKGHYLVSMQNSHMHKHITILESFSGPFPGQRYWFVSRRAAGRDYVEHLPRIIAPESRLLRPSKLLEGLFL